MSRLTPILALISHYKYAITIVAGVLMVGFVDDNSYMRSLQLKMRISDLEAEIQKYNEQNEAAVKQLQELKRTPKAFSDIARKRYFMKADDEDIFVLSDDENTQTESNETVE